VTASVANCLVTLKSSDVRSISDLILLLYLTERTA